MTQRTLIFLAGLLWAAGASAQTTRVRGQVTDAADGKPLQFVSVVFPGTTTGITTDEQGIYALETRDTVSRVQASMVGYATRTLPLTPGTFNHVDFALEAVEFGIGQVVITPGENPSGTTRTAAAPTPRWSWTSRTSGRSSGAAVSSATSGSSSITSTPRRSRARPISRR